MVVVEAALVLVLAAVTLGIAAALIMLGIVLLSWAARVLLPDVSGPSSWALGLLVELSVLIAMNMSFALLRHGPLARWECFVELGTPIVLALVCAVGFAPAQQGLADREPSSRSLLALAASFVVLAGYLLLQHRGQNFGIAWAMSGDSRNHAMIMQRIIFSGGLTIAGLKSYPCIVDSVSAIISVADGRSGLPPGDRMVHDAQAIASTFVLSIIGIASLSMASLYQFVPRAVRFRSRIPAGVTVAMFACAGIAITPLVLGTALNEGFLSAYGALPVALAVVVLALHLCDRPSFPMLVLLGVGTGITSFSWTMLAIVPAAASLVVVAVYVQKAFAHRGSLPSYLRSHWIWALGAAFSCGLIAFLVCAMFVQRHVLETTLAQAGAIIPVSKSLLVVIGLASVGFLCVARIRTNRVRLLIPIACAGCGMLAVVWINSLAQHHGPDWIYYSVKTEWIIASSTIWVAFVPIALHASKDGGPEGSSSWQPVMNTTQALAFSTVIYVLLMTTTVLTSPLPIAFRGWSQPTASEVSVVQRVGNMKAPFVVWNYLNSGEDRLGNFWAGSIWDTTKTGLRKNVALGQYSSFIEWAYFAQDTIPSICVVATSTPRVIIVTSDASLQREMDAACPSNGSRIIVGKPAP